MANEQLNPEAIAEFERHMYLMKTNGKYCLINTNYDCVFVVNPITENDGFIMSSKKANETINKFYKKKGQAWCLAHRDQIYSELFKDILYSLTVDEWKRMTKPKPRRAVF